MAITGDIKEEGLLGKSKYLALTFASQDSGP